MGSSSPSIVMGIGVAVILAAIGATTFLSSPEEESFSQVVTVGPVWNTDTWLCTSDEDFMVHGTLRGLEGSLIEINISDIGSQSLYALDQGQLETFSVGAPGGSQIFITSTGTVTGFLTMQTASNADASCVEF